MISTRMFLEIVVLVISVVSAKKTPCTLAENTFTIDETIDGNSGAMSYFAVVNVPGPWYVFRQNPGTCSYKELHFGVNQITRKVYVGMCGVGTSETVAALPDGVNAIAMKYHAYGELEIWANGAKLDLGISQINGRAFSSSSTFQSSCSDQIKVYNRALSQNELETMTALTSDDWECEENKVIGMHSCGVSINGDYFGTDGFADLRHDPSASETYANFDGPSVYSFNSKEKCIAQCEQVAECAYINYNPSIARHGHSDQVGYCYMVGVNHPINDACVTMQPADLHGYTMCKKPNTIGAVLKECRWESNHDQNPNSADYMGWTCANDEILTGFGLSADQHDVTKVRCCKVGGHSSIKSNTCTYVESNHERAKCGNGNDHMVFSGAYDKRVAVNDAVTEILAGKCCEVECDAPWCAGGDWGVDKNNCQVISTASTQAQELVCPTGTIMTEVEDGLAGNAHGVQKVASVTCCALDMIAPPTRAPTAPPSTARPTSAPTTAPSTSLPSMAPTTVDDCLLALKDSSQLTDSQYLSNVDLCLPGCRSPRRALESRQLTGRLLSESNSV